MKTIGKHGRVAVYRRLDSTKGRLGSHKVAMYGVHMYLGRMAICDYM